MTQMKPEEVKQRKAELAAGFDPDGEVGYLISIDVKGGKADCAITKTIGAHLVPPVEGSEEYSDRFVVRGLDGGSAKGAAAIALLAARDRLMWHHHPDIVG